MENLKEVELTEDSAVANENQSFNSTVRMSQSQLESQSGQIILDQSLNSPEDELSILTNEIAQHLKNLLDIRWNIPDKNCEGKMQLNCTKWDTELLESLVTGPLSFGKFYNLAWCIGKVILCRVIYVKFATVREINHWK